MVRSLVALFVASTLALAADKGPGKPVGSWSREVDDARITFDIKADGTMTITVKHGDNVINARASYGVTEEGMLFGVMTKVDSKEDRGPQKGDLFGFTFSINKGELTVSDLTGTRINDDAKKLVEGAYTKK
jgi:hypothetical protein